MQKRTNNLQLEKATNLVCEHWFPFCPGIVEQALKSLEDEDDEEQAKKTCLEVLKNDASLYLLCLKEIQKNFQRIRIKDSNFKSGLIEVVSLSELRNALEQASQFKTHHVLSEASEVQSKRLTEMLISSTTACELSESYQLSKELSYSSAILRQLGYTLISWNYPKIYKKITEHPLSKSQLDREVRKYLGFSPAMLAMSVIKRFGLETEYNNLFSNGFTGYVAAAKPNQFGRAQAYREQDNTASVFTLVNKICEVGEALSRASYPEVYSTAKDDFGFANTEILSSLGDDGVKTILSKVAVAAENLTSVIEFEPMLDSSTGISNQIENTNYSRELRQRNGYIHVLPGNVYAEAVKLYSKLEAGSVKKECLAIFTRELVPKTFFDSVTVYLIDPIENVLYPSLILGDCRIQKPVTIPIKSDLSKNLLYPALSLTTPIREEVEFHDKTISMVAASIGDPVVGIFVVEFAENRQTSEVIPYFKAIKNAFCDCLKI